MFIKYMSAFLGIAVIMAQPAVAASDMGIPGASGFSRPAAFGGVTVRLPLGRQAAPKPEARLQLTTYRADTTQPWRVRTLDPSGLQLGVSKAGKPLVFAGGQKTAEIKQKMELNTGTTLLIVGGILAAIVVVALAAGGAGMGDTCPEVGGSRDHCINP